MEMGEPAGVYMKITFTGNMGRRSMMIRRNPQTTNNSRWRYHILETERDKEKRQMVGR